VIGAPTIIGIAFRIFLALLWFATLAYTNQNRR